MKKSLLLTILCLPFMAQANDSTGTVSTGGVEYIKNEHIAMQKENLFISQDKIKVEYEYRNLTDKDITETVLFPLPEVMLHDYDNHAAPPTVSEEKPISRSVTVSSSPGKVPRVASN